MFPRRGRPLPDLCADLSDAVLRLDERQSTKSFRAVVDRTGRAGEAELTARLERLTRRCARCRWATARCSPAWWPV
jgi:hypothetical protein